MVIKILNVITSGLKREGITSSQLEFMKAMDQTGLQIDIAAVHGNEEDVITEFNNYGCRVIRFPDRKKEVIRYLKELHKVIRREKYDIIHVHGSSAIMLLELATAKVLGVKVRIAHSRNTRADHAVLDKILRPLFNRCYNVAFACGNDAGKWLFKDKEFRVIHNGKDLGRFQFSDEIRSRVRKEYNIGNKTAIGFVGNLNFQKNLPFLLEIIRELNSVKPDCIYFIMGEGPERPYVEAKIKEYGLLDKVVMTGRISYVSEMLQGMDTMLLPSLFEGLPNVVLEWQAAGIPSIVANTVTTECKVCDLVQFLPIDQGCQLWVNKILDMNAFDSRKAQSEFACQRLMEEKFEILENARFIKELYVEAVRRSSV